MVRITGRIKGFVVTSAIVAGVTLTAGTPHALAQEAGECNRDYCAGDEITIPSPPDEATQPVDAPSGGGGRGGEPACTWGPIPAPPALGQQGAGPQPSPDAVLIWESCDGVYTGASRWSTPGNPQPAAATPAPAVLAEVVRVRLEGSLPAPDVVTTPEAGVAALVGYPSFVSVANWTGVVSDGECDPTGLLCVTVTATPSMQWSPGEPDVAPLECSGPGVVFNPEGPQLDVQAAAPEACAHAFEMRTAVSGRPRQWPGVVSVEWSLTWSSSLGGSGSLTPVTKSADVPREVNEVQSVVVSAGE